MGFWNTSSTTLGNEVTYVNNTYKDANGNNKLTTITSTNTSGYRDVVEGSTQRIGDKPNPGLKGLSYAVQNDGKITYKYDDGQGNIKQYNSIQELANGSIVGYDKDTTRRIKDGMQRNLKANVESYNQKNPTSKIGPATGTPPGTGSTPFDEKKFEEGTKATSKTRLLFNKPRSGAPDGVLIYPNDIAKTKQDVMKFDMLKYRPKQFDKGEKFGFSARERTFSDTIGTVILPIPSGISDTNSCNWNQDPSMTADKVELANIALQGITQGGEAAAGAVADGLNRIRSSGGDVGTAFANAIAGQAAGAPGLLTRTTGNVINPNLELLFQSPALRTFGFTFKMSARSEREAKTIIAILRFFKQGMSAQRSESNLFLKTPYTFGIRYKHRGQSGEEHKYIGKIKECALTSFTVNYTPEGQYATYSNGPMVSYEMQMQFQELEPIFNDDYDGDQDLDIGF